MTAKALRPSAATLQALREAAERSLTLEEVNAYLGAPMTAEEREEALALIRWFQSRYPTPAERLAYVRRACRRWSTRAG